MSSEVYMKLEKTKGIRIRWSSISVLLLFMYSNLLGLKKYIYFGSSTFVAMTLVFSLFIMIGVSISKIRKRGLSLTTNDLAWLLTLGIMLPFNNDLKNGDTGILIQYSILIFFVIISKYSDMWIVSYKKYMILFAIIHTICTLAFKFIPKLYPQFVLQLFETKYQGALLNWYNNGYATGLGVHYSQNGIFLAMAVGILIITFIYESNKKISILILSICSFIALLLTGKRGPVIFSLIALLLTYYIYASYKPITRFLKIVIMAMLAIVSIYLLSIFIPSIAHTLERFTSYGEDITNGRVELYEFAWEWFKEKPIFGIGWGGYPYRINNTYIGLIYGRESNMYAHNVYLQLLCEVGIVGFIIFISAMLTTLVKTYKLLKYSRKKIRKLGKENELILSFSIFIQIFFLMYSLTGNPLYEYSTLFPYLISCAASLSILYQQNRRMGNGKIFK